MRTTDLDGHGAYVTAPVTGDQGVSGRIDRHPLVTHTLTNEGHDASEDGTGRGTPIVSFDAEMSYQGTSDDAYLTRKLRRAIPSDQLGVRRLTPRECERLQGFPDDWTLIPWNGKPAPDSRRYAALGDAVTVNVSFWIGQRLAEFGS
jgi:DNA (cytosine-5)-methyltransferase 1